MIAQGVKSKSREGDLQGNISSLEATVKFKYPIREDEYEALVL
jgi:hypothetical protein